MRSFKQQKIAVLLVAITTGVCTPMCFGAPSARGAASGGATVTTSGAAAGGGVNTATSTGNVGAGTTATGNAGTGATQQNPAASSGAASTTSGDSTSPNNVGGTATTPNGTAIPPTGQATQPGVAPLTGGAALTGSTGGTATQQFPIYTGTTTGPTIQSYSASPMQPPQIIGSVSGVGGKLYYISADGYMYYRDANGNYVSFGRFVAPNEKVIPPSGPAFGVAGTTTTGAGVTVPQTQTQVPGGPNVRIVTNAQGVVTGGSSSNAFANGNNGFGNDNDADDVRRRHQFANGTNTFVNGTNTYANDNDADDTRRRRDRDRDRDRDRQLANQNQPVITGTVVGTNGQTYYVASDGMIYYRGSDGNLHIFGSGVPQ